MHTKYTNREIMEGGLPHPYQPDYGTAYRHDRYGLMGRVGEVELGASAIAGVYYLAIFMLGFGFSIGSRF